MYRLSVEHDGLLPRALATCAGDVPCDDDHLSSGDVACSALARAAGLAVPLLPTHLRSARVDVFTLLRAGERHCHVRHHRLG